MKLYELIAQLLSEDKEMCNVGELLSLLSVALEYGRADFHCPRRGSFQIFYKNHTNRFDILILTG